MLYYRTMTFFDVNIISVLTLFPGFTTKSRSEAGTATKPKFQSQAQSKRLIFPRYLFSGHYSGGQLLCQVLAKQRIHIACICVQSTLEIWRTFLTRKCSRNLCKAP